MCVGLHCFLKLRYQLIEHRFDGGKVFCVAVCLLIQLLRNAGAFLFHGVAFVGQVYHDHALIHDRPGAGNPALFLQRFEQGAEGVGFQDRAGANVADGAGGVLPQNQQNNILRIGELEPRQQGLVGAGHQARCGIKRKAQLVFQQLEVVAVLCGVLAHALSNF